MKSFAVRVQGYRQVDESLKRFNRTISSTTKRVLAEEAARGDAEAKMRTPVRTGALQSGTRVVYRDLSIVGTSSATSNGYDYAPIQHDNLEFQHKVGQALYLKTAFDDMVGRINKRSKVELKYD